MPAYMIFIRERTLDKSELEAYAKLAAPSLEGLPIKFLAAYGRQEVLEGPVSRDNLDENGASIWVRRGSRAEG